MRVVQAAALTAVAMLLTSVASAQGLGDAAARERAKRKAEPAKPAKVYTEGDIGRSMAPVSATPDLPATGEPAAAAAVSLRPRASPGRGPTRRGGAAPAEGRRPPRPTRRRGSGEGRGGGPGEGRGGLAQAARPGPQGRSRLQGRHRQAADPDERRERALQPRPRGQRTPSWKRTSRSSPRPRAESRRWRKRAAATATAEPGAGTRATRSTRASSPRSSFSVTRRGSWRVSIVQEPPSVPMTTVRASLPAAVVTASWRGRAPGRPCGRTSIVVRKPSVRPFRPGGPQERREAGPVDPPLEVGAQSRPLASSSATRKSSVPAFP